MFKIYWRHLVFLCLSILVLVLDQVTKYLAINHLGQGEVSGILPILNFSLAFNRGAAFSFLNNAGGWQNGFFIILALFVCLLLILSILREKKTYQNLSFSLIIGGALGNLLDRLHYTYVIDFIDFHLGEYHWPTFNIADSSICIGVVLFLIANLWVGKTSRVR